MSETLHKIVVQRVQEMLADSDCTDEERNATITALETDITKEIIEEKANDLTVAQARRLKAIQDNLMKVRLHSSIAQMKDALFMAVVVGTLIGLLVNQVTDLISLAKGVAPTMPLGWTIALCLIFSAVTYATFHILYVSKAAKIVEAYIKKENQNEN